MTEFVAPPQATLTGAGASPGSSADQHISWGAMKIGRGKAFELGQNNPKARVSVTKRYVTVDGRHVLLEIVPLKSTATTPPPACSRSMTAMATRPATTTLPIRHWWARLRSRKTAQCG